MHRVLSPWLVRQAAQAVPSAWVQANEAFLTNTSPVLQYRKPGTGTLTEAWYLHVAYAYCFGCLLLGLLSARWLTTVVFPTGPPLMADLGPVVGILFLPQTFLLGGYLYDFAELALWMGALAFLFQRNLLGFALLFVLAVLNKETALLLLVVAGGVLWEHLDRRSLVVWLGSLFVVGASIVALIFTTFADHPGAGVELHLIDNLRFWLWWLTYVALTDAYAPLIPVPRGGHVVHWFLLGWMVWRAWPFADPQVRWVFASTAVPTGLLMLVFGYYDEIRALGPVFPGLYLLGCIAVPAIWGASASE